MYRVVHNGFDVRELEKDEVDNYITHVMSRSFSTFEKIMDAELKVDKNNTLRLVRYRYNDKVGMEEVFIIEKI